MTTPAPALALFAFAVGKERTPRPPNANSAANLSLRLVQALCWLAVLFL